MFANEIDINEFLYTKFKRTMVKSIMEFKECKEDTFFHISVIICAQSSILSSSADRVFST